MNVFCVYLKREQCQSTLCFFFFSSSNFGLYYHMVIFCSQETFSLMYMSLDRSGYKLVECSQFLNGRI